MDMPKDMLGLTPSWLAVPLLANEDVASGVVVITLVAGAIVVAAVIVFAGMVTPNVFPEIVCRSVDSDMVVGLKMVVPGTEKVTTRTEAISVAGLRAKVQLAYALTTGEGDKRKQG